MCVVRTSSKSAAFIQNHLNNTTQRINKTTKYKHTQGVKVCVRVIVYNYFRGVRCVVSYINTNQSTTNLQPNRISKEENKKRDYSITPKCGRNYTRMVNLMMLSERFICMIFNFFLLPIFFQMKKQRKNKRNDYFIWRTSSCYIDVCLLFIFLEVFLLSSVPFFLFSHWFSRGYLFFLLRCRFVRLWLEWRKLSHIHLLITTDANVTRNFVRLVCKTRVRF